MFTELLEFLPKRVQRSILIVLMIEVFENFLFFLFNGSYEKSKKTLVRVLKERIFIKQRNFLEKNSAEMQISPNRLQGILPFDWIQWVRLLLSQQ
jgi:hypothetical protein